MHMINRSVAAAMLAGTMVAGAVGGAQAGADDSGSKAFWSVPSLGSASGMPATRTPADTNPAADGQPNSSITRTGVAQEAASRSRPQVAVARPSRQHYAVRTHGAPVSVAKREPAHRTQNVARRAEPGREMHALHRGSESDNGRS